MAIEISKRLVAVNSASSVIRSVISLTVLIWLQRYLLKRIDEEEYKVLATVFPLMLFVPLFTMTIGGGLSRFMIEAYHKGEYRKVTQITSTMWPLCLLAAAGIATVGAILIVNIQYVLNLDAKYVHDAQIMFSILCLQAATRTCLLPFTVGIEIKQRFVFGNLFALSQEVLRITLIFSLLFGVSTRVLWLVVATIPGWVLDEIVIFNYSRRLVPELRFRASEIRRELIKPITKFGFFVLVPRSAAIAREMCLPLILSHWSSAIHNVAYRLGGYVETRFYPTVLGPLLTLQPALTGMHAGNQEDRLRRTFFRMSRYLLFVFLFFAIPCITFHREIWHVWLGAEEAEKYAAGAIVMVLLFVKSIFVFPQPVIAQIALARARNAPLAYRVMVIELTTLALAFVFIYHMGWGAIGAAAATLTASAILTPLLHWTYGLKLVEARFSEFWRETVLPGLLPALVATPVWFLAWWFLPRPAQWYTLLSAGLLGGAVYALVLLRFCLQPGERADLAKVLRRRKPAT